MRKAFLALFRLAAVFLSCLFLSGKAAAADGPFALNFDGVDDYVAIRHSTFFNSHQLTLTAWVRTINTVGERGLINKYAANSLNGWNVFLFNGEVRAWYFRDSANFIWDGGRGLNGGFIADGEWHHIAFVVNSTEGRLYVDGLPVDARFWDGSFGDATTMQEVRLGSYPGSGFFNGRLDEVTIWGRALSATEISASRSNSLVGSEAALNGYYRIAEGTGITARNSGGSGFLFDGALMNGPAWVVGLVLKPGALTLSASTITTNSAVLNGTVSPGGTNANGWFEWGATTNYGNVTPPRPLGGGANSTNFSQSLTGLTFGTIIHFRAMASNGLGMAFGANQGFRTLGLSVETLPATSVTQTSATLNALSNPGGASAIGWFEWGTTTNFGNVTPPQSLGSANAPTNFSQVVTGLSGGVHHFRAVASNSFGLAFGGNQRFPAQIVINEFVNDQRSATGGQVADAREFVELYNAGTAPVNLSGWFVRIVDLTDGVVRFDIPFESGTSLASGSYYVLGQADGVSNVNFDFGMNDVLPNGHAMVLELRDNSEILVDAVACQMFLAHSNATPEQSPNSVPGFMGNSFQRTCQLRTQYNPGGAGWTDVTPTTTAGTLELSRRLPGWRTICRRFRRTASPTSAAWPTAARFRDILRHLCCREPLTPVRSIV